MVVLMNQTKRHREKKGEIQEKKKEIPQTSN